MSEKKNQSTAQPPSPVTSTTSPGSTVQGPIQAQEQVEAPVTGHGPVAGVPEPSTEDRVKTLEQRLQGFQESVDSRFNTVFSKLETLIQLQPAIAAEKNTGVQAPASGPQQMTEKEWDTPYINDLPDSAFAVIAAGGEKDEQGKTVPRTLRHLPHHNAQGGLDLPHLRNALARMNQIEGGSKAEAKKHLCAHAKDSEIVSEFCGEEPPEQSNEKGPGPSQMQEKGSPAPCGQGITKPVGELPPAQPGTIAVTEIRKVFDDKRLFTPQLREKAILRLLDEKEGDGHD